MKQISARQFRVGFADLTEPVVVLRRGPDGTFAVLGTWTPEQGKKMSAGTAAWVDDHFGTPAPKGGRK